MAIKLRRQVGGLRVPTGGNQGIVSVWDKYYPDFQRRIETALAQARGRYGYVDAEGEAVDGTPQTAIADSEFWKVDTKKQKVTHGGKERTLETAREMTKEIDGETFTGEKCIVTLDVAGRVIKGMFEKRYRMVKGKKTYIKDSEDTAVVPSSMLVELLEDIRTAVNEASKDDGDLGTAIFDAAKAVTDPANRVKGDAKKKAARDAKPWCEAKEAWLPASEH